MKKQYIILLIIAVMITGYFIYKKYVKPVQAQASINQQVADSIARQNQRSV